MEQTHIYGPKRKQIVHYHERPFEVDLQVHGAEARIREKFNGGRESEAARQAREKAQAVVEESTSAFVKRLVREQKVSGMSLEKRKLVAANYLTSFQAALRDAEKQVEAATNKNPKKLDENTLKRLKDGKVHFFPLKLRLKLANIWRKLRVLRKWVKAGYRKTPLTGIYKINRLTWGKDNGKDNLRTWERERKDAYLYKRGELETELSEAESRVKKLSRLLERFQENPEGVIELVEKHGFEKYLREAA